MTTPNPRTCPTCRQATADFTAHIAAPGYGHSGECKTEFGGCGARLWRASFGSPWEDVAEQDRPPELNLWEVI
jgi:hypothetical protein